MNRSEADRWLVYARSDLQAAKKLLAEPDSHPRQVCYLSQQGAEKSLKAVLVLLEIEFPFTHDLDRLRESIPHGWKIKQQFPQLYGLSIWAVESRYPGDMPDVITADAELAIGMAEEIFSAVVEEIQAFSG